MKIIIYELRYSVRSKAEEKWEKNEQKKLNEQVLNNLHTAC